MAATSTAKVSHRGQTSVPAELRRVLRDRYAAGLAEIEDADLIDQ